MTKMTKDRITALVVQVCVLPHQINTFLVIFVMICDLFYILHANVQLRGFKTGFLCM